MSKVKTAIGRGNGKNNVALEVTAMMELGRAYAWAFQEGIIKVDPQSLVLNYWQHKGGEK